MLINFVSNHNFIVNSIVIGVIQLRVKAYKLLGVYISNVLKWIHHGENIAKERKQETLLLKSP